MRPYLHPLFRMMLILAALFMVVAARPAAAQCSVTVIATGALASGDSINVTAPPGHTYLFSYTGAATGSITVTGTLNIVNGTGGTLNYVITDLLPCSPIPTLSGQMLALMMLILAGLGLYLMRLRR